MWSVDVLCRREFWSPFIVYLHLGFFCWDCRGNGCDCSGRDEVVGVNEEIFIVYRFRVRVKYEDRYAPVCAPSWGSGIACASASSSGRLSSAVGAGILGCQDLEKAKKVRTTVAILTGRVNEQVLGI